MKRPPKTVSLSPFTRNYGTACSWSSYRPVWRRSRNITRTPGVIAGTALASVRDGRPYKFGVTRAKAQPSGGSAAASIQHRTRAEVC
jgi:hypothetical protein